MPSYRVTNYRRVRDLNFLYRYYWEGKLERISRQRGNFDNSKDQGNTDGRKSCNSGLRPSNIISFVAFGVFGKWKENFT